MDNKYDFLIDEVVAKFGEQVDNLSSAEKLSKEISKRQNGEVSYNTIRRFFNLIQSKQNNYHLKTINTFSRYCGYKNFIEHEKHYNSHRIWRLINIINYSSKKIENFKELKGNLQDLINKNSKNITLLGLLTNKLLLQEKEEEFVDTYNIKVNNIYDSNMLMPITNYCNLVASSLRQYNFKDRKTILELSKKETFIRLYVHHFVDYSRNNHNYIDILSACDDKSYNSTDTAFKYLFLDTMRFFKSEALNFKGIDIPYDNLTNDFVRGRWIAIFYLRNKKEFNFKEFYKSDSILLVRELLVFALVKNDISTVKDVCAFYEHENFKNLHWHYQNEKIIVDLFLTLNFFIKGNSVKALALLNAINLDRNSNYQRLEHNTVLYLYIQIIIEGASEGLKLKFKEAKKISHLELLSYNNAVGLNKTFS